MWLVVRYFTYVDLVVHIRGTSCYTETSWSRDQSCSLHTVLVAHTRSCCAHSHICITHTTNTNTTTTSLEAISKEVQQLSAGEMGSLVFVRRQVSSKGCVSKITDWALLRHSTDRNGSSETDNIVVRTAIDGSTSCTSWISDLILDSEIMGQWRKSKRYG